MIQFVDSPARLIFCCGTQPGTTLTAALVDGRCRVHKCFYITYRDVIWVSRKRYGLNMKNQDKQFVLAKAINFSTNLSTDAYGGCTFTLSYNTFPFPNVQNLPFSTADTSSADNSPVKTPVSSARTGSSGPGTGPDLHDEQHGGHDLFGYAIRFRRGRGALR